MVKIVSIKKIRSGYNIAEMCTYIVKFTNGECLTTGEDEILDFKTLSRIVERDIRAGLEPAPSGTWQDYVAGIYGKSEVETSQPV